MRLSMSVMAHPARATLLDQLIPDLAGGNRSYERIVPVAWDLEGPPSPDRNREWRTGQAAWRKHDPDADWHLVLQDDAIACADLIPGVEAAFAHVPHDAAVSLYLGRLRPAGPEVNRLAARAAEQGASWVVTRALWWGVAICLPTRVIEPMLAWGEQQTGRAYDQRISEYVRRVLGWRTWYTWPSLVDHDDGPSLTGHDGQRRAHRMHSGSALGLSWDGPVTTDEKPPGGNMRHVSHDPFRPRRVSTTPAWRARHRRQPEQPPEPALQGVTPAEPDSERSALEPVPADMTTPQVHLDPIEHPPVDEVPPVPDTSTMEPAPAKPTTRDSAADWRAYGAAMGVDGAEKMTKAQLVAHFKDSGGG